MHLSAYPIIYVSLMVVVFSFALALFWDKMALFAKTVLASANEEDDAFQLNAPAWVVGGSTIVLLSLMVALVMGANVIGTIWFCASNAALLGLGTRLGKQAVHAKTAKYTKQQLWRALSMQTVGVGILAYSAFTISMNSLHQFMDKQPPSYNVAVLSIQTIGFLFCLVATVRIVNIVRGMLAQEPKIPQTLLVYVMLSLLFISSSPVLSGMAAFAGIFLAVRARNASRDLQNTQDIRTIKTIGNYLLVIAIALSVAVLVLMYLEIKTMIPFFTSTFRQVQIQIDSNP